MTIKFEWFRMYFMEKSRKFRFITKFDIIIILSLLLILLSFGVVIKQVFQKDEYVTVELLASGGEWWWGTPPPYYWNADPLQKGAIEYDVFRKPLVEIIDIAKYTDNNRKFMWMKARLKARKNISTGVYSFNQSQLQVGRMITIAPNNITIIAQVVGMEGKNQFGNPEERIVFAKAYSIYPWQADAVVVGDGVTNDKGELVAEILEKKEEAAEITTTTWLGEPLLKRDPLLRDVTIKLRLSIRTADSNEYFLYYQPLKVGHTLNLELKNTVLIPNIIKIFPYSEDTKKIPLP